MFTIYDLCCGAGAASCGYVAAGFKIKGIDINKQPNYPFEFKKADVLKIDLPNADAYHASPPCQLFSVSTKRYRNKGKEYPDVLTPLRQRLLETGKPFIIENTLGAPIRADLKLCGEMFGLRVIRHRIFEIHGFTCLQPPHVRHRGRASGIKDDYVEEFYYYTVVGHGRRSIDKMEAWQQAMGINYMTRREITQAIPPLYTEYIGRYLLWHLKGADCS